MNYILEQAFVRADELSDSEQERIGVRIHEAIERMDDVRWQEKFAEVEGALTLLHDEAQRSDSAERLKLVA